jgi:serine/threonine-protein kinase
MQLGKYQPVHKLATGGMAEVFLAKAAGPGGFEKTLVLKRILPHLAEEPSFVEMFLSEARLAALLNHPNIVQIFDFGEAEGSYFLAMEYIDGPNLRVLLKRAVTAGMLLQPTVCARIIALACEGLAFAHTFCDPTTKQPLGLVHRDISPDNILLSRQGAVKVVDFGIAKAAGQSHKTQTGMVRGKLTYMPPEQLRLQTLDRRVDVYALGVVLYELLTGRKPFDATTEASIVQSILFEPLIPAVQRRPDLPEALQRILDHALAKDRDKRYPDCRAFQMDLERFILSTGEPVGAWQLAQLVEQMSVTTEAPVPPPMVQTPSRSSSKNPTISARPPPPPVEEPSRPITAPISITRTEELPPPSALPVGSAPGKGQPSAANRDTPGTHASSGLGRALPKPWIAVVIGGVLLVGGGGFLWRSCSASQAVMSDTAPVVAAREQPAVAPEVRTPPPDADLGADEPLRPSDPLLSEPRQQPPAKQEVEKPTVPPETKGESSSPSARAAPTKGTLELRVRPYATVFLDGKRLGDTPMGSLPLPAGRYTLRLVNRELKEEVTKSIEVRAGALTTVRHTFDGGKNQ